MKTSAILKISLIAAACALAPETLLAENAGDAAVSASAPDGLWETLSDAVRENPFRLYASAVFLMSIIHCFFYGEFLYLSNRIRIVNGEVKNFRGVVRSFLKFLSEVEIIFALWLVPLLAGYIYFFGWNSLTEYLDNMAYRQGRFAEPVFVLVIMAISASRPIIDLAETAIERLARLLGGSVMAWWACVLIFGSLLGSFITEPAAITICAMLLAKQFFKYSPSEKFKYATIGLLLVAISIGGTITPFAAPPVLMVKKAWDWDIPFMVSNFAWKAVLAIVISVVSSAFVFRREFAAMQAAKAESGGKRAPARERSPMWIVSCHLMFLAGSVVLMHYTVLVVFLFFMYLGFLKVTRSFQDEFDIEPPLLVCIFLASLVIHGSFQGWWIAPVLNSLSETAVFLGSLVLTSFNDNAAITYLATHAPDFSDKAKYLIVAGAVTGGGLTLIANAPNLAGASILKAFFNDSISPSKLFWGALPPTIVAALLFYFL